MLRNLIGAMFASVLALAVAVATPALAAPADDLDRAMADYWQQWLAQNPISASMVGEPGYDARVPDVSAAAEAAATREAKALIARIDGISDAGLSPAQRVNKAVLRGVLDRQVREAAFGQRDMLFTTYVNWHESFASLGEVLSFDRAQQYRDYLTRLEGFPVLNAQVIARSRTALKGGFVHPCAAMTGFENTITGAVAGAPEATRFYAPFTGAPPRDASAAEWAELKARAVRTISGVLAPEYTKFAAFYSKEYQPRCRKSIGASAMPQGREWYESQVGQYTTTSLSPDQIHQLGLSEVARIGARMDEVAAKAGYPTRAAFVAHLRTDPRYYPKSAEELLGAISRQAKTIDGMMPRYFGTLPRLPYGVRPIPAEIAGSLTTAYYKAGSPAAGLAGFYYVNTTRLDQRPLFEVPALAVHEAVPGHHHQTALQQELDLPPFRRHAAFFSAFVEGWGLYTEFLGEEMGIYDTPEKMMGRLSFEMLRASRLVVDTGMHAKGWSRQQAVDFMKANTALTDTSIDAEVTRYIAWPGQALGYKIGEIRFRGLRARAEAALGARFDLRRFHDALLTQGAVPLDVLESQVDAWIVAEKSR